ncbi:hypothetical protein BDC45DRAFT_506467, partial [Circinella umbellata]
MPISLWMAAGTLHMSKPHNRKRQTLEQLLLCLCFFINGCTLVLLEHKYMQPRF